MLNEAFSDPKTISLAYYQASLVVDHLVQTYGEPALWKMLRAYGRGLETEDALKDAYGISIAQLQTSFDGYTDKHYGAIVRALKAPELKEKPSLDELEEAGGRQPRKLPRAHGARRRAEHGRRQGRRHQGASSAPRSCCRRPTAAATRTPTSRASPRSRRTPTAPFAPTRRVLLIDNADVESARKLAGLLEAKRRRGRAREDAYRRLVAADPFDSKGADGARPAGARAQGHRRSRCARSAARWRPSRRTRRPRTPTWPKRCSLAGQTAEAKRQTLEALEIAPSFERAQDLLLKIAESPGTK